MTRRAKASVRGSCRSLKRAKNACSCTGGEKYARVSIPEAFNWRIPSSRRPVAVSGLNPVKSLHQALGDRDGAPFAAPNPADPPIVDGRAERMRGVVEERYPATTFASSVVHDPLDVVDLARQSIGMYADHRRDVIVLV